MRATALLLLLLIERNTVSRTGVWAALDQMKKENPGGKGVLWGDLNQRASGIHVPLAGRVLPRQPEALGLKPLLVTPPRGL